MKSKSQLNQDCVELQSMILNPGLPDKDGRTDLNKRADANSILDPNSDKKIEEENIVLCLFNHINIFKSQDISLLVSFIRQSKLSEERICRTYFEVFMEQKENISLFNKIELIKYFLETIPIIISDDFINLNLFSLKKINPWLYADIISYKSINKAIDFVEYLVQNGKYESSSFIKLFLKWVENPCNFRILKRIESLKSLISDNDAIKLIDYKLKQIKQQYRETEYLKDYSLPRRKIVLLETLEFQRFIGAVKKELEPQKNLAYV